MIGGAGLAMLDLVCAGVGHRTLDDAFSGAVAALEGKRRETAEELRIGTSRNWTFEILLAYTAFSFYFSYLILAFE